VSEHDGTIPGDEADTDTVDEAETDALLSRLHVIEDQPLESRAAAFAQINDELQARLEGGDGTRSHA
jgi:hypothetical protein